MNTTDATTPGVMTITTSYESNNNPLSSRIFDCEGVPSNDFSVVDEAFFAVIIQDYSPSSYTLLFTGNIASQAVATAIIAAIVATNNDEALSDIDNNSNKQNTAATVTITTPVYSSSS